MLLTLTTTHTPATDLGYLLHKNPSHAQSFDLSFGKVHLFYPEVSDARCTVSLLLDVDPVALVRNRRGPSGEGQRLDQYVNDRPYVASSFLSVAIAQVLGSALAGRSRERPDLADTAIPLHAKLAALPCRGGESLLRQLFEPLGYSVIAHGHVLDDRFPEWGSSHYLTVGLEAVCRLTDLLSHLYVLIPVLDDDKHYWVSSDEVDKLLRHGGDWLSSHPERELIVNRYLKHQRRFTREAMARLSEEDQPDPEATEASHALEEEKVEERVGLNDQRLGAVVAVLKACGAKRVLDLGCGEGRLLQALMADGAFEEIVGMDVSYRALEIAGERLKLDRLPDAEKQRVRLVQGSLMYRDRRLCGYDAAAVVEVIEHLDPPRLAAFERVVFEFARPATVILTTPNSEYNLRFENLPVGKLRHRDHRFEWTRREFGSWARAVAERFGYTVRFVAIGPEDAEVGAPTQMGVFTRDPNPP